MNRFPTTSTRNRFVYKNLCKVHVQSEKRTVFKPPADAFKCIKLHRFLCKMALKNKRKINGRDAKPVFHSLLIVDEFVFSAVFGFVSPHVIKHTCNMVHENCSS